MLIQGLHNLVVCRKNPGEDADDSSLYDQQDYFLGRPVAKAYRTLVAGTIGQQGMTYPEGTWVVKFQWFDMVKLGESRREYRVAHEYDVEMWPVESLIRVGADVSFAKSSGRGKHMRYDLDNRTHNQIMRYGNWNE